MDSFEFHRSFHKCSVFYFIWFCNTRMQMVILFMQIDEQFSLQCQSQWQSMCSRHSRELAISTMAQQQKGWDSITQLLLQQLSLLYQSWVFCLMSSLMTMLQAVEMYIHGSSKLLAQSTCCLIVIDVLCHLLSLPDTELFTHHQAVASLVSDEHTAIRHAMSQCMSHLSTFVTPILQWACREWWNTYSSSQWVRITCQHNRVLSKQQQLTHAHRAEYFTAELQHEHMAIHTIQQWQTYCSRVHTFTWRSVACTTVSFHIIVLKSQLAKARPTMSYILVLFLFLWLNIHVQYYVVLCHPWWQWTVYGIIGLPFHIFTMFYMTMYT